MTFDDHCAAGERADQLLIAGDVDAAEAAYDRLYHRVLASGTVDSYVMAKLTLGRLLARIDAGDLRGAHRLWTAELDESLWGLGIHALERGHTSVHDLMLYLLVSAFLHSLTLGDRDDGADAVNDLMSRVVAYAVDERPDMLPLALSNWSCHLDELFDRGLVPDRHAALFQDAASCADGGVVPGQQIEFPPPSPWRITWRSGVAATFYPDGRVYT